MAETAIFLGAGASKAEGAPLQGELFKEYFSSPLYRGVRSVMNSELTTFFWEMFHIDVKRKDLTNDMFPTFEEVLGFCRKCKAVSQDRPLAFSPGYAAIPRV